VVSYTHGSDDPGPNEERAVKLELLKSYHRSLEDALGRYLQAKDEALDQYQRSVKEAASTYRSTKGRPASSPTPAAQQTH
jgi:hypothetical protein